MEITKTKVTTNKFYKKYSEDKKHNKYENNNFNRY